MPMNIMQIVVAIVQQIDSSQSHCHETLQRDSTGENSFGKTTEKVPRSQVQTILPCCFIGNTLLRSDFVNLFTAIRDFLRFGKLKKKQEV